MSEAITEKKTPEQLGAEIRMYVDAGRRISLLCGIEIGRRLVQAKEMLEHGEWLPWLERETEFSDRSAARYMKLFEEYGAQQQTLFGAETNSPTLSNLPISKAFALLSVPESDRIEFAEEVNAEQISVRELEKKIKEREMQLAESEKLREETSELLKTQDGMLAEARDKIAELAKLNKELENRPVEVAVETVRDEEAIETAVKEARAAAEKENERAQVGLKKQLADAEKNLKGLKEKLEKAERELTAAKETADSTGADAEKKIAEAGKAAEQLRAELEEARKALKASDADVTAFGIRFNTMQKEFGYMMTELRKAEARDAETGAKLREAVRQLLNYFGKEVEKA